MLRTALLAALAVLVLVGCTTAGRTIKDPGDSSCMNDCLGTGGTPEFCRSRCEY
jgi:hypothetical protein